MIDRKGDLARLRTALRRSRVVALLGPRQCGKTTLARSFVPGASLNYFDLEDPQSLARLRDPDTALRPLKGLVVIDVIQRRPELFPLLRVLVDRRPLPARFLILGSASPELLRQSSETLAGRLETVELEGLRGKGHGSGLCEMTKRTLSALAVARVQRLCPGRKIYLRGYAASAIALKRHGPVSGRKTEKNNAASVD